jgi:hypothetical protein
MCPEGGGSMATQREPEEILDEEHEHLERVCAIDVAKDSGQVCVRMPTAGGRRSKVWAVERRTDEILKLGEFLVEQHIQMITLVHIGLLADLLLPAGGV